MITQQLALYTAQFKTINVIALRNRLGLLHDFITEGKSSNVCKAYRILIRHFWDCNNQQNTTY